ncbi:MAG: YbfB/YjiJ family MFS transporter [Neptuniibacter sp.]|nr:YbfB/YjiJ family MFS transporter [Neptuniibacter sp.]
MGLARFALGMLLPSMGTSLSLSYSEMGFISTGNFIGYLISVFLCGQLIQRFGERKTIVAGLVLIAISMFMVSLSSHLWLIIGLYMLTGIGSGAANITAMTLVAHWFSPKYRGRAAGYMIIGNGLGITASGLLIPWLNNQWLETGWRIGWASFAIAIAVITVITALLIRNNPKELSISAFGKQDEDCTSTKANTIEDTKPTPLKLISHIGVIYFVFGFTYVIYTTFIVTTLVEQYGFSEAKAGSLWMAIGIISIFSGALFGWVSDHFGRKTGIISVYIIQTASYLLAASELGQYPLFLSMILFGLTAFSIPAIIAATISDMLPPMVAGKVFGYVTLFFGTGQIAGPVLAGYLAELSGGFTSSYLLASCITILGIVITALLKYEKTNNQ